MAKTERIFKIHPAIGIARVGDAKSHFIGPEIPGIPANWDIKSKEFLDFKVEGKIKRQAARFRIWEYKKKGSKLVPLKEVNLDDPDIEGIEWTVHLANRKASFYLFNGQKGAKNNFSGAHELRNRAVKGPQRAKKLEIDEGPKSINGKEKKGIHFKNTKPEIPILTLGELQTDKKGRLLVLGGKGTSKPSPNLPKVPPSYIGASCPNGNPWPEILEYANNNTWFDDVSAGQRESDRARRHRVRVGSRRPSLMGPAPRSWWSRCRSRFPPRPRRISPAPRMIQQRRGRA